LLDFHLKTEPNLTVLNGHQLVVSFQNRSDWFSLEMKIQQSLI
jgi:hypothetical protein